MFARLSLIFSVYEQEDEPRGLGLEVFFARVLLGPPLRADRFGIDFADLAQWAGEQSEDLSGRSADEISAFVSTSVRAGPTKPTVWLRETDDYIEIGGLPGPDGKYGPVDAVPPSPAPQASPPPEPSPGLRDEPDTSSPVPTRDWIPHRVSDFVEWMDRPMPLYEGVDDDPPLNEDES